MTHNSRAFSPAAASLESPQKSTIIHSSSKSWCSSPFSNLVALSPEGNSLSFQLDFSPGASFTSPHIKFPHDHIHASPQSNAIHSHSSRDHFTSLFSPSIFSPFNKTLKTSKMDKAGSSSSSSASAMYSDFLDAGESNSCSAKLISEEGDDTEESIFKHSNMPAYQAVDMQNINMNFGGYGPVGDHMQQSTHSSNSNISLPSELLSIETDGPVTSLSGGVNSLSTSTPRQQAKAKKNGRNATSGSSNKKAKPSGSNGSNAGSGEKPSSKNSNSTSMGSAAKASAGKAHNLFASPATLVRGSNQQPSNISPLGTDAAGGHCNCKKSKCLKLYCECFAALRYCSGCNCVECHNCPSHEKERQEAIVITKERNSQAFQSKVNDKQGHTAGCNCKKSKCLKKYCECYEGAVFCGDNCKCLNCQNFSGSAKLEEVKKNSSDRKEKVSAGVATVTKDYPSPRLLTVSNVTVSNTVTGVSQKVLNNKLPVPNIPPSVLTLPLNTQLHLKGEQGALSTPLINTPRKKRSRRCLSDSSDISTGSDSQSRKAARGYTSAGNVSPAPLSDVGSSPNSILSGSQTSVSVSASVDHGSGSGSGPEMSPDKHLDMMDVSSESSPELALLNSTEKLTAQCKPTQLLEPRYPFFGQDNHRATKLTALRCLEFLDNKDLYTMSVVNKLWCQAAMDDALWE